MKIGGIPCLTGLVCVLAVSVSAQAQQDCSAALLMDRVALNFKDASALAAFRLIEQSSSSDADLKSRITIPIKGLPVSGDIGVARRRSSQYFENSSLMWTHERLVSVATQTLSKNAVKAYKACIDGEHKSGPRVWIHSATEKTATAVLQWISAEGAPTKAEIKHDITGGKLRKNFKKKWNSNDSQSVIIEREQGTDLGHVDKLRSHRRTAAM